MVNKKLFLLLFAILLVLPFITSAQDSLGTFRINTCVNLIQTCSNCTSNNITSILFPNSTQILGLSSMTVNGSIYNYTFCQNNTLGTYTVNGIGNPNGVSEIWVYTFDTTPTGNVFNSSQGLLYLFMLIVFIGLFLFSLYSATSIQAGNVRNEDGEIIQINWRKYLKIFAGGLAYMFFVVIIWLAWNLSFAYLQMRGLSTIFRYLYRLTFAITIPVGLLTVTLSIIAFLHDKKIQEALQRGIPVE